MTHIRKFMAILILIMGFGTAANVMAESSGNTAFAEQAAAALKEDAVCTRCHNENEVVSALMIYQTKHGMHGDARTPTCQGCHGESAKHRLGDPSVKGRAPPDVVFKKGAFPISDDKERANICLTCHSGGQRSKWEGAQHQTGGLACNDCHIVHQPADKLLSKKTQTEVCFNCHKEQRADSSKTSHHPIGEGKVICSDCHNPHGSTGPKLLRENTVTETCYLCHAEKRGPFLWEHQPATESCTNCHTPHGSNITPLLKSRAPFLCDECHNGPHNSQSAYAGVTAGIQGGLTTSAASKIVNPSSSAAGRACMNCHVMVHGSNSPAGALLHR